MFLTAYIIDVTFTKNYLHSFNFEKLFIRKKVISNLLPISKQNFEIKFLFFHFVVYLNILFQLSRIICS